MAEETVEKEKTTTRVVGVLSAQYFKQGIDPLTGKLSRLGPYTASRGEEIELPESEARRLDAVGGLLPEGSSPEDAHAAQAARLDEYRAQRGDQEALARHSERLSSGGGEIVNVEAPVDGPTGDLAGYIRDQKPNVDDTVALAENDPEKARKVLEAERSATGGSPRAGVESKLQSIIDG